MTKGVRVLWGLAVLLMMVHGGGCGKKDAPGPSARSLTKGNDLGPTIGKVGKVVFSQALALEGYGLVGGLPGTGSTECPPPVKEYLRRYAQSQVAYDRSVDVDKLINSRLTAVVYLEAVLPDAPLKGDVFDVKVTTVSREPGTSLDGGWLYTADLNPKGLSTAPLRSFAVADGPVYIDKLSSATPDKRNGCILGGGRLLEQPQVLWVIGQEDFRTASVVRDLIKDRFGSDTATALSPQQIELKVPLAYRGQRWRFLSLVGALYLNPSPQVLQDRVTTLVRDLAVSKEKTSSELALEGIGPPSLAKLGVLLQSSDEQTRMAAARCMLNLGSPRGLETLAAIAYDSGSPRRQEAIKALAAAGPSMEVVAVLLDLLQDPDLEVTLTAYEEIMKVDPRAVSSVPMLGGFILDQIAMGSHKAVVALRSGKSRIALFGPIACRPGRFLESQDGTITLDSRVGEVFLLATRRHPTRGTVMGPLRSSFKLHDLVQVLCAEPVIEGQRQGGLGLSYSDLLALLKQACDSGFVDAEFWAGPLSR
jgi:hypothetical protein